MKALALVLGGLLLCATAAEALTPYTNYNVAGSIDIEPGAVSDVHSNFLSPGVACTDPNTQGSCITRQDSTGAYSTSPASIPVIAYKGNDDSEACFMVDFPIGAAPGQESTWTVDIEYNLNRTSSDTDKRVCWSTIWATYTEAVPRVTNGNYLQGAIAGISYVQASCAPPALSAVYGSIDCQIAPITAYDANTGVACVRTAPDQCMGRHSKLCLRRAVLGCANNAPVPANVEKIHVVFPMQ